MTIDFDYSWSCNLSPQAEIKYDALCAVFDWNDVHQFVEKCVGVSFQSTGDADDAVARLFTSSVAELGERIAKTLGIKLSDEQRERLGLTLKDIRGRRYRLVPEDPRQMFLFPVDNPTRRIYIAREEAEDGE